MFELLHDYWPITISLYLFIGILSGLDHWYDVEIYPGVVLDIPHWPEVIKRLFFWPLYLLGMMGLILIALFIIFWEKWEERHA